MMVLAQHAGGNETAAYILIGGMIAVVILYFGIWLWTLYDCISNEPPGSTKTTWVIAILLFGPFAAIVYGAGRRRQRIREHGR